MSVLSQIDPAAADASERIALALESNHIVYFPQSPIPLPDTTTLEYLRTELPSRLKLKNISYHPEGTRVTGLEGDDMLRERTCEVLKRHLDDVAGFIYGSMPQWRGACRVGTCSFRPIQERGRDLKPHASNELVHVDAGAYGATNGDRIFRFFVNVNDREDRVWASKGSLQDVLERYGVAAGLLDAAGNLKLRIDKSLPDQAFSAAIGGLARLSPLAHTLDSSPYDRTMRKLHNYMKDSDDFKQDMRGYEEIRFPPSAAWMVFTDGVSHASLSGQFALVTTVIVSRKALRYPQFSPYALLAGHSRSSRPAA
ncbi:MAG: Kdo hydroxylase family protein [Steroidobacteraceae bacterium]